MNATEQQNALARVGKRFSGVKKPVKELIAKVDKALDVNHDAHGLKNATSKNLKSLKESSMRFASQYRVQNRSFLFVLWN